MATTKIWPVRDNLARVVEYAENHLKTANPNVYTIAELKDLHEVLDYAANYEKTAMQYYVTGINCIDKIAYEQMMATKRRFGKTGGNLAYHAYQSFLPDEVTPEKCHEIGIELARRLWGDRYEVLVSTHLNTHCVHNHFVINSVSYVDGKKLNNDYAMYFKSLRAGSDEICAEHGLSVIKNPGKSKNKWMEAAEKRGEPTAWNVMRTDIDEAVRRSMTDRHFYRFMKDWGYTFDFNPNHKYPTLRPPGSKKVTRFNTLGEDYTPERITRRILAQGRPYIPPPVKIRVQHYRYKGSFQNMKSVSGLYVMFLIFTLILRKIINHKRVPNQPQPLRYTPELRAAIRQMEKYSAETRLLCRHKIETSEQLKDFIGAKNQERVSLERARGKVYNKMKSAKTPEKMVELKSDRDKLSAEIKVIRRELFYAGDIEKRHEEIREKLRAQREYQAKQLEQQNPQQNKNKERGYTR